MGVEGSALVQDHLAGLELVERALRTCPEGLWERSLWTVRRSDPWIWPAPGVGPVPERTEASIQCFSAFWLVAYHCLWFVDFYVTRDPAGFESPESVRGGPEELDFAAAGAAPFPAAPYDRDVLLAYAQHCRRKVEEEVGSATAAELEEPRPSGHPHAGKTYAALLAHDLAHVREHGEQLLRFVEHAEDPA